jgi:hypothetical protein
MKRKRDAGAASLKKRPTIEIRQTVRTILGALDQQVHVARLEAQNRIDPDAWDWPDVLETTMANLELHVKELRGRVDRRW